MPVEWCMWRVAIVLLAGIAVVGAGCGASDAPVSTGEGAGPRTGPAIEHATGPTDLLVDVHAGVGAFAPLTATVDDRPVFRLYGDGIAFVSEEGSGLPALSTYVLSPDGVEAVLEAADAAGLLAEPLPYGEPGITDVGSTIVALRANGGQFDHAAYALGFESEDDPLLTAAQVEARADLQGFVDVVTTLPVTGPELFAAQPSLYEPEAVDVIAWELQGDPGEGGIAKWPLAGPLDDLPATGSLESRCVTVTGGDLRTLAEAVEQRDGDPRWRSGGTVFEVGYRTLLPGQAGCSTEAR